MRQMRIRVCPRRGYFSLKRSCGARKFWEELSDEMQLVGNASGASKPGKMEPGGNATGRHETERQEPGDKIPGEMKLVGIQPGET